MSDATTTTRPPLAPRTWSRPWLLTDDRIIDSSDLINPDQPPFWRFAGDAMATHPFGDFVYRGTDAHTSFLSNFFGTISREATETLRPKYGHYYGFDYATRPNAEMVAWTLFEYR